MSLQNTSLGLLILRISFGLMMLLHGIAKITHGIEGIKGMFGGASFIAYGVYVGEVLAPLLLIVGFRTKIAALLLAITMLVAILMSHAADIFTVGEHGSWGVELAGLYLFGALALFFTGGGNYALSTANRWD